MNSIPNIPDHPGKKRIIIAGGGFGGLKLAEKLNRKNFQIVLIDQDNFHQFQPLLYQVAITGLEVSSIAYPFRKNFQKKKDIHFRMAKLTAVNPASKSIETDIGNLSYDYLVIAVGCDTNYFGNNALKDTTLSLKSAQEALLVRNRVLQTFEDASVTADLNEIKKMLTFVVVGGGATGVELSGALADMKNHVLAKDYPELDLSLMEIHLIDAGPRLLGNMSEKASKNATETLKKRGVTIHQKVAVSGYENEVVKMADNTELPARNVLWVGGITGSKIKGFPDEVFGKGDRLLVNEYCQVNGYTDIFAIGDISLMQTTEHPKGYPQVAQGAIQTGAFVAKFLENNLKGKKTEKFSYKDKGTLATVGRNDAVADLHKLKFGGFLAWLLWLGVHIFTIIGVKNRILIILDWAWSYLTYDLSLRILLKPKKEVDEECKNLNN